MGREAKAKAARAEARRLGRTEPAPQRTPPWTPLEEIAEELLPKNLLMQGPVLGVWRNSLYRVCMRESTSEDGVPLVWLSIMRNDRTSIHDWRHLQRIKNELCGVEREAVEIYPAESRLMDEANQYHLWVLPAGMRVPFGFRGRFVSDIRSGGHPPPYQRPL